jgi:RNA 3'-terminal phosphate cyclase (ATP)
MLQIDGSQGEGGGQVLRSALALSMVTATPFRMVRIRAGRKEPGLKRQHLTAVRAAVAVCGAAVEGDALRSTELTFSPGPVRGGEYTFSVGTAGSTTLVLQTVLPALLLADCPTRVTLEGGTHNPMAPPFPFLARTFLPLVNRMGPRVTARLERPGFFPAGGGRFAVEIEPCDRLVGFDLRERGKLVRRSATATVARLPRHIAERELKVVGRKMNWTKDELHVEEVRDSHGPGNVVTMEVESEHICEVFTAFGEVKRPAEAVANDAVRQCRRYLASHAPVGEYLCDQLMLPMAIAGGGTYLATCLSGHAKTHIELIHQFLDCEVRAEPSEADDVVVRVEFTDRQSLSGCAPGPAGRM